MAVWSSLAVRNIGKTNLIRSALASRNGLTLKCLNNVPVRSSGHGNIFDIKPTQFRFLKLRDLAHFYFMLGAVPLGALILYCHIFIGPAKLAVIPEGYVPKHWEYYQHPITRWIAKVFPSPQECYEKEMHKIYRISTRNEISIVWTMVINIFFGFVLIITYSFFPVAVSASKLEHKIQDFMKERDDYQAWYFKETSAKYVRKTNELGEDFRKQQGKTVGLVM